MLEQHNLTLLIRQHADRTPQRRVTARYSRQSLGLRKRRTTRRPRHAISTPDNLQNPRPDLRTPTITDPAVADRAVHITGRHITGHQPTPDHPRQHPLHQILGSVNIPTSHMQRIRPPAITTTQNLGRPSRPQPLTPIHTRPKQRTHLPIMTLTPRPRMRDHANNKLHPFPPSPVLPELPPQTHHSPPPTLTLRPSPLIRTPPDLTRTIRCRAVPIRSGFDRFIDNGADLVIDRA